MSDRIANKRRETLEKTAKRDAKIWAEAKMNYGKGAGNRRKVIWTQIEHRMQDPTYKRIFEEELQKIDKSEVLKKVESKKNIEKLYSGAKKTYRMAKQIEDTYYRNKSTIDGVKTVLGALFKG